MHSKELGDLIRYHFNFPGDPGQLIARIGMPEGKDPEQSFLNKFDHYAGSELDQYISSIKPLRKGQGSNFLR